MTEKRVVEVLGARMAYVEAGRGRPIVLLHGNPTSSHLWRNVIPHLAPLGRCLAPDLIGMGDSAKLADSGPGSYGFAEHRRHLDALLQALGVERDVVLVLHDWGSALGFDWARRRPEAVAGIAYAEAIVRPVSWEEWAPGTPRRFFEALRGEAGEEMVLRDNVFIERVLPNSVLRPLAEADLAEYRRPYLAPGEGRRPMLSWPRQAPIDGRPADVVEAVAAYARWLSEAAVPKLLLVAEPGALLVGPLLEFCRRFPNQEERRVAGRHFPQEDSPDEFGRHVADWFRRLPPAGSAETPARSPG
ncbi:MAG: haloalkane dehalogenase [Acidimicrobiales bacterium]